MIISGSSICLKRLKTKIEHKIYYGHLLDHVMHQDYILKPGVDAHELKKKCLKFLDERHAVYPAEHNVGHLYLAAPALIKHYKKKMIQLIVSTLALVNKQCLNIGANTKIKSLLKK